MNSIIKKPSAWLPITMSLTALLFLLGYVVIIGVQKPQATEGAAARIFQLLLAGQVPIAGYFAIKWFAQKPKQVLQIIVIQILAALVPLFTVFFLEM